VNTTPDPTSNPQTHLANRVLLRPEEVAEALGIGRTAVYELMRSGELRSVKIGKSRRIPTEAVGALVARLAAREEVGRGAA
jgi:excisionase family DNA binding protein